MRWKWHVAFSLSRLCFAPAAAVNSVASRRNKALLMWLWLQKKLPFCMLGCIPAYTRPKQRSLCEIPTDSQWDAALHGIHATVCWSKPNNVPLSNLFLFCFFVAILKLIEVLSERTMAFLTDYFNEGSCMKMSIFLWIMANHQFVFNQRFSCTLSCSGCYRSCLAEVGRLDKWPVYHRVTWKEWTICTCTHYFGPICRSLFASRADQPKSLKAQRENLGTLLLWGAHRGWKDTKK